MSEEVAGASAPIPVVSEIPAVRPIRATEKEFTATLPGGLVRDGKVYRTVTMRTTKVADRRVVGDKEAQENPAKIVTNLLSAKIVSIDGVSRVNDALLRSVLSMDRDALLFDLRQMSTGGSDFQEVFQCPKCGSKNSVVITEASIRETLKPLSDEQRLRMTGTKCSFDVELPAYGFKGTFAYSDGHLQELIGGKLMDDDANIFDLDIEILSKICLDFNGEGKLSMEELGDLDTTFLNDLQDAIAKHSFGYDFNPECRCFKCKTLTKVRLNPINFLYAGQK